MIVRRLLLLFILLFMLVITPLTVAAQEAQPLSYQTVHVVQYGDTLYSIARYYGVAPEAIAAANNIYNYNFIYVGQRLVIPAYSTPTPTIITYYVRSGDTLARIARLYNTTVSAIAQLNHLMNINRIYVGQALFIQQGSYPPEPQIITYYVRYGDTLGRIARYYGVSIASIVSYNGIYNPNRIYAGTVLYIPINYW